MNKRPNTSSCKIVATLGPASDSREQIQRLLAVGVDVFRLNTSHGVLEDHATRLRRVREVSKEAGIHAGVLLDLQGPKIRLGTFVGGGCELINGSEFTITTEKLEGTAACASTSYAEFARDVRASKT